MGGRGGQHMRLLAKIAGVEVAAFCDPDEMRLQEKCREFEQITGKKPRLEQDLRRVLDDRGIDAVTIATCNHWHALATIWACQASKHVYVEKPVCHDLFEGTQMVAASRRYNKLVQGGTQRRSSGYVQRAIQALNEGMIGDIYMARWAAASGTGTQGRHQIRSLRLTALKMEPSSLQKSVGASPTLKVM